MFNWVVKVVPQPPAAPGTLGEETTKPAVSPQPVNKEVKNTEGESSGEESGVLGWLSNGFISALPQPTPTGSPRLSRSNSGEVKSAEDGERNGVINWVAQSLTKVLPQPDEKYREKPEEPADEHTEVYDVKTMPDYDPLPHIPVVDMTSDDEADTMSISSQLPSQQVVNWLKQALPQPAYLPPGAVPIETSPRPSRSSASHDKVMSPPPQSLSGISLDTDDKASGMVGWFVSGLGLRMPQLVIKPKDDTLTAAEVLQKAAADMVLEDVDSDNEGQLKQEQLLSVGSSHPVQSVSSVQSVKLSDPELPAETADSMQCAEESTKASLDAETQTGRWTPFIESIKKEAEGVAMATMEERLLEERMEMARMAEDVARHAAEMTVRQMTEEGSIKLSMGSQDLLEEEPQEPELIEIPVEELNEVELYSKAAENEECCVEEVEETSTAAEIDPPSVHSEPVDSVHSEPVASEHSEPIASIGTSEPERENVDGQEEEAEPLPSEPTRSSDQDPEAEEPDPGEVVTSVQSAETNPEADPEPVVTQQPQKEEDATAADTVVAAAAAKEDERPGEASCDRPEVNVEDVDSNHKRAAEVLTPQDPTTNTLTVPVPIPPKGGRHSKPTDKE